MINNLLFAIILVAAIANTLTNNQCGKVDQKFGGGLVVNGKNFKRGAYPWMVALFDISDEEKDFYFCVGTYVLERKVLTAAHCLKNKGDTRAKTAANIKLLFGAYNIDKSELETLAKAVEEVIIHENWNPNVEKFDSDIALLITENAIGYAKYYSPICLWEGDNDLAPNAGIIAGWGSNNNKSQGQYQSKPKQLAVPIVDAQTCYNENKKLFDLSSSKTFCGGTKAESGPCTGDSGAGMFFKYNNVYYLRGIVSSSLFNDEQCDVKSYAVYTNALLFTDWIKESGSYLGNLPSSSIRAATTKTTRTPWRTPWQKPTTRKIAATPVVDQKPLISAKKTRIIEASSPLPFEEAIEATPSLSTYYGYVTYYTTSFYNGGTTINTRSEYEAIVVTPTEEFVQQSATNLITYTHYTTSFVGDKTIVVSRTQVETVTVQAS